MDAYLASEESYKNGYKQGYADAMAELDSARPETSRRGAKYKGVGNHPSNSVDRVSVMIILRQ